MGDIELLQAINEMFDVKLKQAIDPLANDIKSLKVDVTDIKSRLKNVEAEVVKTNLTIENKVYPMIQAIRDGQALNREKLAEVNETVDEMASTVLALDILHTKK